MEKETQDKITQLQMFEQNLQTLLAQRQQFSTQLVECESALTEVDGASETYKVVGNIMVKTTAQELKASLEKKKELLEMRMKTLESQETSLREKSAALKEEVMKEMNPGA